MGDGLIKIHVKNASNLNPDSLYAWIHFNHPELVERLRAISYHSKSNVSDESKEDDKKDIPQEKKENEKSEKAKE